MSQPAATACTLHYVCCGVPFRIHAADRLQRAAVESVLPHLTTIVDSTPPHAETFALQSASDLERIRTDLMIHVANHAPDLLFVHAGVVGWHGRALIFPGQSFSGKTTLVAELVKAGATYYSDEYAVIDEQGLVHPFTRALQMREPGGVEQRSVSLADLTSGLGPDRNSVAGVEPIPVSTVVLTRFVAGASWSPQEVTPAHAILEMLRHTIAVQRTPARAMRMLHTIMAGVAALQSPRGDAAATARILLQDAG
jgi:hypothetical protein